MSGDSSASLVPGLGPGTCLSSRYRLDAPMGRGGMSVVWRATHLRLDQSVAIKILPEIVQNDRRQLKALEDEAKLVMRLSHPGIRKVMTLEDDPTYGSYVVMELIDGITLDDALAARGGPLTAVEAMEIGTQACAALAHTHEFNIVHRDLKPKNIFLEGLTLEDAKRPVPLDRIRLKITDFGLGVRIRESVAAVSAPGSGPSGTLAYMSPEQLMGERPTSAMDVYSLGATLYELLSGEPPFNGGDLATQIERKPAPALPESAGPARLRELVAACLSKNPRDRPRTMNALAAGLAGKEVQRPSPTRPNPARVDSQPIAQPGSSRRDIITAGGVGLLLLLGGLWAARGAGVQTTAGSVVMPNPGVAVGTPQPTAPKEAGFQPQASPPVQSSAEIPGKAEASQEDPSRPNTREQIQTENGTSDAPVVPAIIKLAVLPADDSGASLVRTILAGALRTRGAPIAEATSESRSEIWIVARLSAEAVENGGFDGLVSTRVRVSLTCVEPAGPSSCGAEVLSMAGAGFSRSASVENAISKLEPRLKAFVGSLSL